MEHLSVKQRAFLAAYARIGTICGAAEVAKCSRFSHRDWMENPEYAADFAAAEEKAIQAMEAEARERGVLGVEEPVIYQGRLQYEPLRDRYGHEVKNAEGQVVYGNKPLTIRKPSDNLLMFMLKSKRPHIYRDNASLELSGPGGGPISVAVKFQDSKDGRSSG